MFSIAFEDTKLCPEHTTQHFSNHIPKTDIETPKKNPGRTQNEGKNLKEKN